MGRRMTLDEFLKAFTDEETESVPDAISVRVSDAEVHSLGVLFIQLMGGLAQCLRRPPKRRLRRGRAARKKDRGSSDPLLTDLSEERTNDDDDLIH
jgi:DNA invertase Pin-like site-specific DNA recombinase